MHQLLLELNQEVGVQGSMVVSPDGIIIDAALDVFLSQDLMAAMASTAITNLKNSLAKADIKEFSRFIIESSFGKMVLLDAGIAYLVVLLEKGINLDVTLMTLEGKVRRIQSAAQIKL